MQRGKGEGLAARACLCLAPRMVTCELSRVCWLKQDQHNMQHMQLRRRREQACQEPKTALGAFRKRPAGRQCR